jgi:UDP-glucose 4-epimerase
MKRAFVTGASGFIGASVVRQLLERGVQVAVLRRANSSSRRLNQCQSQLLSIDCEDGRVRSIAEAFKEFSPETVFHLGWGGVGSAFRNDARQQFDNLQFAVELAELSVESGVEHWIGAGSQAEYGPKNEPIRESDLPRPTTLYGAAKLSTALMTERISLLGGIKHSWLRIFSTYGPDDNPDWMLPTLIRALLNGERPALTAGDQLWDYLHVNDASRAFVAVADAGVTGIFNLGSGVAVPLRNVIETIRDLIDPGLSLGFGEVPYRPDQVMRLHADVKELRLATNWQPMIDLQSGLRELVNWHRLGKLNVKEVGSCGR